MKGNGGSAAEVSRALRALGTRERALGSARYFKTGPGEYGEGDVFVGVPVPEQRKVATRFKDLAQGELSRLLDSEVHEDRLVALLIMAARATARTTSADEREALYRLYLARIDRVNNWDLVDSSAPAVIGGYLLGRKEARGVLDTLVASDHLWSRRTAMLASYAFIRRGEADDALRLAEKLLEDRHDLMHKAAGWMLREVGQRVGLEELRGFLRSHAATMPRTMLRYAIEKLTPQERAAWLSHGKGAKRRRNDA